MKENNKIHKNNYIKNLIVTKNLTKLIVNVVSGVLVTIFVLLGVLSLLGILKGFGGFVDFFVFALLSGTGV
jgi:hypothetical protein